MNHDEFTGSLAEFLGPNASERVLGVDAPAKKLPDAPFKNFFSDEFLTLLYRSKEPCSSSLTQVRHFLEVVADSREARHVRAAAAVSLGRFVKARRPEGNDYFVGHSHPQEWFHLARQLNSVVGSLELANALLAQRGQRIEFDLDVDPLPRIVQSKTSTSRPDVGIIHDVAHAWYLGARVTLRHVQRRFNGWGAETFGCALACVVNYLTLLPAKHMSDAVVPLAQRREALVWMTPLWNRLIEAASERARDPQAYHSALIEQQLAVYLRLDDLEQGRAQPDTNPPPARAKPGQNQVVIVAGVIPKSSERSEAEYLKQYEVLRKPMAFTTFPSLAELRALRARLSDEFPWATEAISVIMSDLFARRRHGVLRLGMAPVLLVGPPGTGKTRFAQRLSDLLGTPNTVINLAGMTDVKLLKGVTRGWATNRPSRMLEFIQQMKVANPLFVLDEVDKAHSVHGNGGDPQEALLDLLEPGNARRYQDIYLMAECDLSHCLYVATSNSLSALAEPLLSRLRPVLFPAPGPEHAEVIVKGTLADLERSWNLPAGALTVTPRQLAMLRGLAPREMRRALLDLFGRDADEQLYTLH